MKHVVAGTAGHIDHGKTSLVRALTGVDTDRLKEEKQRGISIDIGFAHLDLGADLRVAFVDVPGHERFIKNMLAGVGGVDMAVLVVAADESIKPQTREHFDICRLLGIPRGLVALTKSDAVDPEIAELVKLEVEEFVSGSFLEGAPIVAVSSITGSGLQEFRQKLREIALAVPPRASSHYFRLPIDRAFSLHGFGTVVTGTLLSGTVSANQEVELHPGGKLLRVRGLQVHGEAVGRASAGQRTAVNVAGIEAAELSRGMSLAQVGRYESTSTVDCSFELLKDAKELKARAPVHFHSGTAEVEATISRIGSGEALAPGARAYVRLRLKEPLLLLPGDRFIIRRFSPVVTIGGGTVVDIRPPKKASLPRMETLEAGTPAQRLDLLIRESGQGMPMTAIVRRTGMREEAIREAAGGLKRIEAPDPWYTDPRWFEGRLEEAQHLLREFHRAAPLQPGMGREDLRTKLFPGAPAILMEAVLAAAPGIVAEGETVRLASHRVALKADEEDALRKIENSFEEAGLAVPSTQEVLVRSGVEPTRARTLLQMLLRQQRLVRVGDELVFHRTALDRLKALLAERKGARFQVAEFKDWTGVSRKYAIPLLEFLDRQRLTRREGEYRLVL